MTPRIWAVVAFVALAGIAKAQEDEDYSMYADVELAGDAKRFCTSKVLDLSPNKLISIGFDYKAGYDIRLGNSDIPEPNQFTNRNNRGLRLAFNAPLISKTNWLVNLGATYLDHYYAIDGASNDRFAGALQRNGLRSAGVNVTVFKPLNEKRFILFNASKDLNGDYTWNDIQPLRYATFSAAAIYGWKKHDRLLHGFGIARTYRVGELNYIPVYLYNYTFPNRKWGVEALFPARANIRRTFNPRTLAFFGYELEGNSYLVRNSGTPLVGGLDHVFLRRSELRIRFTAERSLKDFLWISFQAGFRYNYNFNVDDREFFRGFGDDPYFWENTISNTFYANVSINLVSP